MKENSCGCPGARQPWASRPRRFVGLVLSLRLGSLGTYFPARSPFGVFVPGPFTPLWAGNDVLTPLMYRAAAPPSILRACGFPRTLPSQPHMSPLFPCDCDHRFSTSNGVPDHQYSPTSWWYRLFPFRAGCLETNSQAARWRNCRKLTVPPFCSLDHSLPTPDFRRA